MSACYSRGLCLGVDRGGGSAMLAVVYSGSAVKICLSQTGLAVNPHVLALKVLC